MTNEGYESYINQINCHIWKKKKDSNKNTLKTKIIIKLKTIILIEVNTEVLNMQHKQFKAYYTNEIIVVSHIRSNYDYHFIIIEIAEEFGGNFNCLQEDTWKCKTFSVPITKEVKMIS